MYASTFKCLWVAILLWVMCSWHLDKTVVSGSNSYIVFLYACIIPFYVYKLQFKNDYSFLCMHCFISVEQATYFMGNLNTCNKTHPCMSLCWYILWEINFIVWIPFSCVYSFWISFAGPDFDYCLCSLKLVRTAFRQYEEHFVELPPEICSLKIIGFSKDIGSSLSLLPSVMRRLENLLVAIELKEKLSASFQEGTTITANHVCFSNWFLTTIPLQFTYSYEKSSLRH